MKSTWPNKKKLNEFFALHIKNTIFADSRRCLHFILSFKLPNVASFLRVAYWPWVWEVMNLIPGWLSSKAMKLVFKNAPLWSMYCKMRPVKSEMLLKKLPSILSALFYYSNYYSVLFELSRYICVTGGVLNVWRTSCQPCTCILNLNLYKFNLYKVSSFGYYSQLQGNFTLWYHVNMIVQNRTLQYEFLNPHWYSWANWDKVKKKHTISSLFKTNVKWICLKRH